MPLLLDTENCGPKLLLNINITRYSKFLERKMTYRERKMAGSFVTIVIVAADKMPQQLLNNHDVDCMQKKYSF